MSFKTLPPVIVAAIVSASLITDEGYLINDIISLLPCGHGRT